ncbi:MAG: hypothetical protein IPK82_11405 [Polyangiaceae bacterium]|nr:hypothetical protein [Polyangiaceae bacterium]
MLKGRLSKIILIVSDDLIKTPGLEVRRDDTVIGTAQFGLPIPIGSLPFQASEVRG